MNEELVSDRAKELIFSRQHNFKSIGALYGFSQQNVSYRLNELKKDPNFSAEFGKKVGFLSPKQKLMLYEEWGEPDETKKSDS